ncbi:AraC family transcriptional regulator ligand-binding domain-containing protein [Marinobacter sp. M216]|uniref:AraC family transcriptional regulator ligand-binding domain-containing protein n=1 Tax=Marinobacter albus TaxID=3030833 RepID=A0ABT7HDQ7_9GAMM|nr:MULTISPECIES: AraC family transcriptional regulator [unclassified Marinobacter]MBW7471919.1 AraC family transcriptional regulator [Marinobacter sp. F4218]MDK9558489.1 AraC family transcriptional regulator ligand-binding domain-containing protein [Marinobacter sp. M216]
MATTGPENELRTLGLFLVPGVYMRVLAETVRQLGHNDRKLYEGLNFTADDLKANDSRVFVTDAILMAQRALDLAGPDGLSFALARELRLTIHGTLGFAALTSPTFEGALDSVHRYLQLRAPFLSMKQSLAGERVLVQLCTEFDVPELYPFLAETVSATLILLTEQLLDRDDAQGKGFALEQGKLPGVTVRLSAPEPPYYRRFADQFPVQFQYGQPEEMLVFPRQLLEVRMRLADADASEMAREQCEFELQKALKEQGDISLAIRNMLRMMPGPLPSLEVMAERFCVSSRTLKRRLAEKDTHYREIVEAVLKDRAIQLLRYTNQSVSEIAYELGYADLSNFSRAFRKWTGKSASEFREDGPDPAPEVGP